METELFGRKIQLESSYIMESNAEVNRQLRAYEAKKRNTFELTIEYPDTFFGDVWRTVAGISYGETRTYGEIAIELDTAPIAVGNANSNNPLPILIPCHRLVGTDSLRGYRYPGLQEELLRHENEAGYERLQLRFAKSN